MYTFKQFLDEAPGGQTTSAPNAGGVMAPPNAGGPAPAPTTPAAPNPQQTQSANLAKQIQELNAKLQKLMQQKAIIDRQIGNTAPTTNPTQQAAAQANQATVAATA